MQALAVVLFPVLLMLFALAMERFEARLNRAGVREQEVQEFLDAASSAEVATLAAEGFPNALARFRTRRRRGGDVMEEDVALLDDRARRAS
ncbi:hypothetical protein HQ325_00985 [Rhodococcus sp. BP-349]|jgi:hypothetical protein|uniref:Broad-specificity NMP kinase n=1 Tax=Rhodococcoides corynebacterioides TaxID=53972 RepID=A0ABS2KYG5_9NOCA|nr:MULTISPECIES: hypothetical protein [Rhodococcus]KQU28084.1 hypothetical protein ASG69_08465 [Rhodococcus sp. Leaf225]KQU46194.1 hypothetical protein ASH03_05500 [Rhodococcus sp. Leaf258]MBM7416974.1 broad-specificity NMP kinase [Rhodococcus corynebacterioides]MBP1115227.1 broad-specificity NMP kinase [Rhodococcus sp. PvP016]MBY6537236.1 hypothetical protein [Rhodococcus sp. BP-363]